MSARSDALLATIIRSAGIMSTATDAPRAFAAAVAALRPAFPLRRAAVALCDRDRSDLEFYLDTGEREADPPGIALRDELHAVVERGEVVSGTLPWPKTPGAHPGLLLPLVRGGDTLGLIGLVLETEVLPGSQDMDTLKVWGYLFGGIVSRLRRYDEAREREALYSFALRLSSELDLRRTFPQAIGELKKHLKFDEAGLLVLDESAGVLRLFSATAEPWDEAFRVIPLEGTASGEASSTGKNVIVDDTSSGEFRLDRKLLEAGVLSHVAQPLLKSGRVVGSLSLVSRNQGGFRSLNRDLLAAVGSTLALAVDNTLLFTKVVESEDRYASVVENANELIYRLDRAGRITFANAATSNLLGIDSAALLGQRAVAFIAPEDRPGTDLRTLLRGACEELRVNVELRASDGRRIPTRHHIRALSDALGRRLGFQGIAIDRTGEREVARVTRLHQDLVEAVDDFLFMADVSGRLLAVNRKARLVLGLAPEDVSRLTIWDLHPAEEHEHVEETRQRLLEHGTCMTEFYVKTRSGELIPTRAHLTYSPATATFQGVFRDIREEQLVQERLLQVERMSALGEMASSVAHTFNNLLAVIGTTAQVAKQLTDDPRILAEMAAIQSAVHDGGEAVRVFQNLAHKPGHKPSEDLDLNRLLKEVVAQVLRQRRADVPIAIEESYEDLPSVPGNGTELRDVFMNLLLNAIDAMPGGGVIRLWSHRDDRRALVRVIDEGSGMTPDVRQQLFTPFFSTKGERGAGLGLAIALNVISSHGGSIQVTSLPEVGTQVDVTLPLGEPDMSTAGTPLRVLLVTREPLLRLQMERRLQKRGIVLRVLEAGSEALAALERERYDCVFADIAMSHPSALEIAEEAVRRSARAIVLAGWRDEVSEQTIRKQCITVLRRPFSTNALLNQLRLPGASAEAIDPEPGR